ncbi:ABC transporter ATP-binding protein [Camelimonas lactis]|uniref:Branched-chain amino acid transport system ATP-binding protein n=1 Tax=Camelimonas lactis TaxID=659006 RepID=A0A4R2GKR6_9HYPH|nr:ABC transporter ATP-binding protein [Camelimonas lactis]TCO09486.1 branched-chain amino acid transport system ATP-binding protein [Camelimonas lactis]
MLKVEQLGIRFGGVVALDGVSFSVAEGEIYALIGPNGAGKTTLFNCVSGLYVPTGGSVFLDGADISSLKPFERARRGMTRTFQNLQIFEHMTVVENVMAGARIHEKGGILAHMLGLRSVKAQNAATRRQALAHLDQVGIADLADQMAGAQSYGVVKRLEIARALATQPRVLMLDEPVAGCNATETAEVDAVIRDVARMGVTVVLVEHDMHMVMGLADRVHVLNQGRTLAVGTPEEIRRNAAVIEAYLGVTEAADA